MKQLLKITFFSIFLFRFATADAQVLPLDTVLSRIEKSNPDIQMYNAKVNAINSYAEGAKNWEAPNVGAGLWMTPYKNPTSTGSLMISIEQNIPNQQKLKAKQDYMLSMSAEQIENKNYVKNQLFAYAKNNYYGWAILKKKLMVLKESESVIGIMIKSAEANYSNSDGSLNMIYKTKARLAELRSSIAMTENEMQQKNIILNTLMNSEKNLIFDVDTTFKIMNYEMNIPDSSQFQNNRSDLKAIEKSADILRFKQNMELVKRKPDFGIRYSNMTPFTTGPGQFNVMGMMTIPIVPWSSKEYKANVKGLDFEINELQWKKQSIMNETSGKLGTIITSIKNSKQQIKIYNESIIPALRSNLNTSQLAYGQNKESLFVVLDAWEALNMARIEYLSKIEQLLYQQVEYEKELEQK